MGLPPVSRLSPRQSGERGLTLPIDFDAHRVERLARPAGQRRPVELIPKTPLRSHPPAL